MQFSITFIAAFAAVAMAAPWAAPGSTSIIVRDTADVNALQAQASAFLAAKEANGCSKIKCVFALAPTVAACAAAAAEEGLNPIADAGCIIALGNSVVNPPAACSGC
ncbi:hypothetical protein ACEQ8H_004763 [Pleosporales sp. CAS-2024a]